MYKRILKGRFKPLKESKAEVMSLIEGMFIVDQNKRFSFEDIRNHEWFGDIGTEEIKGFVLGKDIIEVNESLLKKIEEVGLDPEYTRRSVQMHIHNNESMTYYLLFK